MKKICKNIGFPAEGQEFSSYVRWCKGCKDRECMLSGKDTIVLCANFTAGKSRKNMGLWSRFTSWLEVKAISLFRR